MSERGFTGRSAHSLRDPRLRATLARATESIETKRRAAIAEVPNWAQLRSQAREIKDQALDELDTRLVELEERVTAAGGTVHWARDAAEANATVVSITHAAGANAIAKVKSMTTEEIGLNGALQERGITPQETDLAEFIVQLADDHPSHILVPAIHRNRSEIRDLFRAHFDEPELTNVPEELASAARRHLRSLLLEARIAVSGANFAIAETGTVCVVESEGNGRMCTTLPETLITVCGLEKVIPRWCDLAPFLELLPRSATGERMNPYTSCWTGVTADDGPSAFHLVLLDNGRTDVLADRLARQTLRCIRCAACLNVCPVYQRVGGHAYGSVYPGPIGAILTPQLVKTRAARELPFASTLCGACYEVCPVEIDIPSVLVHLRGSKERDGDLPGRVAMGAAEHALAKPQTLRKLQRLTRLTRPLIRAVGPRLPGLRNWTKTRELPEIPTASFRDWWDERRAD